MAATASDPTTHAALSQWLRLLWDMSPPLHVASEAPFIAGGAIHLPASSHWRGQSAAAAHAAAHLVYSPARFDGTGLAPIARALTALLEDARVEALAMRELPGLARIWRPLHTASPALGAGFEALMQRLARALADPSYDDPDAWVRKGRTLFYLDPALGLLALRTPAEVRRAATLLGNDIGQARLQFNAKTYRPMPAYRDDHRWMWDADVADEAPPPPAAAIGGSSDEEAITADAEATIVHYPEWDRLISRVRPDWCRVAEHDDTRGHATKATADAATRDAVVDPGSTALQGILRRLLRTSQAPRRADEGETFDLPALVDLRIARRMRQPPDARVYRGADRIGPRGAVTLLIDQSASSAARHGTTARTLLQAASSAALAIAAGCQTLGVPCSVAAFESRGRQAVTWRLLKHFDAPAGPSMAARVAALKPGGSTRLGAAFRHATQRLVQRPGGPHWLLVLSDGEAHDIDVHDRRYLPADARHAVRSARQKNVHIACLVMGEAELTPLRRVFGSHRVVPLTRTDRLPQALARLRVALPLS